MIFSHSRPAGICQWLDVSRGKGYVDPAYGTIDKRLTALPGIVRRTIPTAAHRGNDIVFEQLLRGGSTDELALTGCIW
jgi:hypothetical protein